MTADKSREEMIKNLQKIAGAIIYDDDWNKLADWVIADRKRILWPVTIREFLMKERK